MSDTVMIRRPTLAADLVPFFFDPATIFFAGRIEATDFSLGTIEGIVYEAGDLTLQVVSVLTSGTLENGDSVQVHALRNADELLRARTPQNHWNNLNLAPGSVLLLATVPTTGSLESTSPRHLFALAGMQLINEEDPAIGAARRALGIERALTHDQRRPLVAAALAADEELLRRYTLAGLERGRLASREGGVKLIVNAIAALPQKRRLELARKLATQFFFDTAAGADETNIAIVQVLAQGLVAEQDLDKRAVWANLLASRILRELASDKQRDAELREQLIAAVRTPSRADMLAALGDLSDALEGEHRARLDRLSQAWESR